MNGTWEVRLLGAIEFVPLLDDGTGRVTTREDRSTMVVPQGIPGAQYRFRSDRGDVSRSVRIESDFPAVGRGLDG